MAAKLTYTVVKGDTLSEIDDKYYTTLKSEYPDKVTSISTGVKFLAELNNIPNPDLIYVGQKLIIIGDKTSVKKSTSKTPKIDAFGLQSTDPRTVFATWRCDHKEAKEYVVEWEHHIKTSKTWFGGAQSTVTEDRTRSTDTQSVYTAPPESDAVRFRVKTIGITITDKNGKEKPKWTSKATDWKQYSFKNNPPSVPSVPSIEITQCELTTRVDNLDPNAEEVQFNIVKNDTTSLKTVTVKVTTTSASYTCNVSTGARYKVRCRAKSGIQYSEWSNYSSNATSIPAPPKEITVCRPKTKTSIYLEWTKSATAKTYDICYTTKAEYFDYPDQVQSVNGIETNSYEKTGLETGEQYFFKVRTVDEKGQQSVWTDYKSVILGSEPEAPTTWSSTTTAMVGEPLVLYWVHNTEDGSSQTWAELEIVANGETSVIPIQNSTDEDEKDKTSSYVVDTKGYEEGSEFLWRVRTAGILTDADNEPVYGEWSIQRKVDVYAYVELALKVTDYDNNEIETLESYPFVMTAEAGPSTQTAIGFHVEIISNIIYETIDNIGNVKIVNEGESVYSSHFDTSTEFNKLLLHFTPGSINLENNAEYTLICTVTMDSGLTATNSVEFTVGLADIEYEPSAIIDIDDEGYTATIRPYCEDENGKLIENLTLSVYRREFDGTFTELATGIPNSVGVERTILSEIDLDFEAGVAHTIEMNPLVDGLSYSVHWNGEKYVSTAKTVAVSSRLSIVYIGNPLFDKENLVSDADGTGEPFFMYSRRSSAAALANQVTFRNNGSAGPATVSITSEGNNNITFVTDPHPALDYARYRIVAIDDTTGMVSYDDIPAQPIGGTEIVIQWDEVWSNFDLDDMFYHEDTQPYWAGSMLKLPYNIDISDGHSPDVELVEYIGREHPVSYYGTQRGATSTWSFVIPKDDEETLYALRRLARWMGDVYIREPSGSGYWANISVSWSQRHNDPAIPVTLNVARVEGGI